MKTLLFVAEVLSPSTTRFDRFTKRRLYQDVGIPAYWIVDADQEAVEVWTPASELPSIERIRAAWHPDGVTEAFVIDLEELFRAV